MVQLKAHIYQSLRGQFKILPVFQPAWCAGNQGVRYPGMLAYRSMRKAISQMSGQKPFAKQRTRQSPRSGASSRQFVQMCLLPWLIQRTGMTTCSLPTFRRQAHCLVCMATGPPRRVADPENMDFLESLNRGQCPRELEPPNRGTPINVNLLRKEEEWSEPEKPRYVAFSGSGRTLAGEPMSSTPQIAC